MSEISKHASEAESKIRARTVSGIVKHNWYWEDTSEKQTEVLNEIQKAIDADRIERLPDIIRQSRRLFVGELQELHTMQLAAIMTASIQNTESTVKDRITISHTYWTAAYGDVCRAIDREMVLIKQNAEMREILEDAPHISTSDLAWFDSKPSECTPRCPRCRYKALKKEGKV